MKSKHFTQLAELFPFTFLLKSFFSYFSTFNYKCKCYYYDNPQGPFCRCAVKSSNMRSWLSLVTAKNIYYEKLSKELFCLCLGHKQTLAEAQLLLSKIDMQSNTTMQCAMYQPVFGTEPSAVVSSHLATTLVILFSTRMNLYSQIMIRLSCICRLDYCLTLLGSSFEHEFWQQWIFLTSQVKVKNSCDLILLHSNK